MRRAIKCSISLVLVLTIIFCMIPANTLALDFESRESVKMKASYDVTLHAGTFDELVSAINTANENASALINLTGDIAVTATFPEITGNITINGANYTLLRADTFTGKFFAVNAGKLTLGGGLVIDGNNSWQMNESLYAEELAKHMKNSASTEDAWNFAVLETDAPVATARMFTVTNGDVVVNDVTIKNHVGGTNGNFGYGLFEISTASSLEINDGAHFYHNATKGGVTICYIVATDATVVMNGGVIEDNFFANKGGIFYVAHGYLEMNGGTIYNNRGIGSDGTAVMIRGSSYPKFVMNGGTICSNVSLQAGQGDDCNAVNLSGSNCNGILEIHGGKICHNTGRRGGGVTVRNTSDGKCTITGGEIVDNIAVSLPPIKPSTAIDAEDMKDFIIGEVNMDNISIVGGVFSQNLYQEPDLFKETMRDTITDSETYGQQYGFEVIFRVVDGEKKPYFRVVPAVAKNERTGETFGYLQDAVDGSETGDVITLLCNQEIVYNPLFVTENLTFDMNGYTIYGSKYVGYYRVSSSSYATLTYAIDPMIIAMADDITFKNGTIDAVTINHTGGTMFFMGEPNEGVPGNLTIESGTYIAESNIALGFYGNLEIEGGYFDIKNVKSGVYGLDCNDSLYNSGETSISVSGGTFKNFDPEENGAEGENTDFCAYTYVTTQLSSDTWQVVTSVCWNMQTTKHYETVAEGLSKAKAGETIQLLVSTKEEDLQLLPDTKLDINGLTLIADNVIGVSTTHVYDSTNNAANGYKANGVLRVLENLLLADDNCAIPVYSPVDGGYIFVDILFNQGQDQFGDISRVNALVTSRTTKIITLFKDGASDNDIQIGVRLTVNGTDSATFVFTDVTIENVMNSNGGKFNLFDRMFYANFTGFEDFDSIVAEVLVIAHGNVIDTHKEAIVLK